MYVGSLLMEVKDENSIKEFEKFSDDMFEALCMAEEMAGLQPLMS